MTGTSITVGTLSIGPHTFTRGHCIHTHNLSYLPHNKVLLTIFFSSLLAQLWSLFGPTGDGIVVKNEVPSDNLIMNKASHYPLLFGVVKVEALPSLSNHDASYGMENERRRELLRLFINKYYRLVDRFMCLSLILSVL